MIGIACGLGRVLDELPAASFEAGFWSEATLLECLRPIKDAYDRLFELTHEEGIALGRREGRGQGALTPR